MRWIERLESAPRGVYCGGIGWVAPADAGAARRARFSVAIRTATIVPATSAVTYGVGSGIVWDSEPRTEYEECLTKARALAHPVGAIGLIETMRWSPRGGIRRLDRHLSRLGASADYFDLPFDPTAVRASIAEASAALAREARPAVHRLRLQLESDGTLTFTSRPFDHERRTWRAVVAAEPVSSSSPLLFHKTTHREIYDRALAEVQSFGADEVILWNERGELTEGSRTNLVLKLDGRWLTPARECGLLAGVLRGHLLDRGWIAEAVLKKEDLLRAERAAFVSALRGGIAFELA
jgi:para-aminobenzoate synthetase/4-amino-4-deoxychorismate lyase